MATRKKPIDTCRVEGSNGYALELNDFGNAEGVEFRPTAVIVGTTTGKRHANVTLEWADLESLHDWIGRKLGGE